MLRCIIVDDEKAAISELEYMLENLGDIQVVGIYANAVQALENIVEDQADIAFLDIEMPGITGVELARRIRELDGHVDIVFTTAYRQYALDAIEIGAVHYLLKPIREEKLLDAIGRVRPQDDNLMQVLKGRSNLPEKISVKIGDSTTFIKLQDVVYIESMKGKTILTTKKEKLECKEKLQFWEEALSEVGFIRCHRSYVVNMDYVYRIKRILGSTYEIALDYKDVTIPVGKTNLNDVKRFLNIE